MLKHFHIIEIESLLMLITEIAIITINACCLTTSWQRFNVASVGRLLFLYVIIIQFNYNNDENNKNASTTSICCRSTTTTSIIIIIIIIKKQPPKIKGLCDISISFLQIVHTHTRIFIYIYTTHVKTSWLPSKMFISHPKSVILYETSTTVFFY